MNILYKVTADSDKVSSFHEIGVDINSTLALIETDGGFTACNWRGELLNKRLV